MRKTPIPAQVAQAIARGISLSANVNRQNAKTYANTSMIDIIGLVKFLDTGNSMVPVTSQRIAPIRYK